MGTLAFYTRHFHVKAASTKVSVIPTANTFTALANSLNDTFTVYVVISDVFNLWNWQVKILFDSSMINCEDASVPSNSPFNFEIKPNPVIDNEFGFIMLGASQYGDEPGASGDGVLAMVMFKIARMPPSNSSLGCDIAFHLEDTYLNDPNMDPISFTPVNGFYECSWSPVNLLAHGIIADKAFTIVTESNCTLTPVPMNFNFNELSFNATGASDDVGYVNVTLPKSFMWGNFTIKIDGKQQSFTISSNSTCAFLYFEFPFTAPNQRIVISAEFVVAEYPFGLLMLTILLVTTFVAISLNLSFIGKEDKSIEYFFL